MINGYELNQNEDIRMVNLIYVSGSIPSSQGNFALLTAPATMNILRSGKDTILGAHKLYGGSSQICREVWLNLSAEMQLTKASGTGELDNTFGAILEADTLYKIPVANANGFWLSGNGDAFWSIWE